MLQELVEPAAPMAAAAPKACLEAASVSVPLCKPGRSIEPSHSGVQRWATRVRTVPEAL